MSLLPSSKVFFSVYANILGIGVTKYDICHFFRRSLGRGCLSGGPGNSGKYIIVTGNDNVSRRKLTGAWPAPPPPAARTENPRCAGGVPVRPLSVQSRGFLLPLTKKQAVGCCRAHVLRRLHRRSWQKTRAVPGTCRYGSCPDKAWWFLLPLTKKGVEGSCQAHGPCRLLRRP